MTTIDEFYRKPCDKIDPSFVNAYLELGLDEGNESLLVLDHSWGQTSVDLEQVIKDGETKTHLSLYPDVNPTTLQYISEDQSPDCINGEDLSKIIPFTNLKGLDLADLEDGDTIVYDSISGNFKPDNVSGAVSDMEQRLASLEATVGTFTTQLENIQTQITALQTAVSAINTVLVRPEGIPEDATIAYGNVNLYSDHTGGESEDNGIYTHDPSDSKDDDKQL